MQPIAIVLAAGKGTRMKSDLPKVLFPVLGRPMIHWVLDALAAVGVSRSIVVVGYQADRVKDELRGRPDAGRIEFALQEQQLGTGHAVARCSDALASHQGPVLVLAGDSPLVQPDSLRELLARFEATRPSCLLGTLLVDDPTGLGRIVRDDAGAFVDIVEHKDADASQRAIREVNMSTYVFDSQRLNWALGQLKDENAQREYYLTDCPRILKAAGDAIDAAAVLRPCESRSVNTPEELEVVEGEMRRMGYPCKS